MPVLFKSHSAFEQLQNQSVIHGAFCNTLTIVSTNLLCLRDLRGGLLDHMT